MDCPSDYFSLPRGGYNPSKDFTYTYNSIVPAENRHFYKNFESVSPRSTFEFVPRYVLENDGIHKTTRIFYDPDIIAVGGNGTIVAYTLWEQTLENFMKSSYVMHPSIFMVPKYKYYDGSSNPQPKVSGPSIIVKIVTYKEAIIDKSMLYEHAMLNENEKEIHKHSLLSNARLLKMQDEVQMQDKAGGGGSITTPQYIPALNEAKKKSLEKWFKHTADEPSLIDIRQLIEKEKEKERKKEKEMDGQKTIEINSSEWIKSWTTFWQRKEQEKENDHATLVVMKRYSGNLLDLLKHDNCKDMLIEHWFTIMATISTQMEFFLTFYGYLYTDLKPLNIFFMKEEGAPAKLDIILGDLGSFSSPSEWARHDKRANAIMTFPPPERQTCELLSSPSVPVVIMPINKPTLSNRKVVVIPPSSSSSSSTNKAKYRWSRSNGKCKQLFNGKDFSYLLGSFFILLMQPLLETKDVSKVLDFNSGKLSEHETQRKFELDIHDIFKTLEKKVKQPQRLILYQSYLLWIRSDRPDAFEFNFNPFTTLSSPQQSQHSLLPSPLNKEPIPQNHHREQNLKDILSLLIVYLLSLTRRLDNQSCPLLLVNDKFVIQDEVPPTLAMGSIFLNKLHSLFLYSSPPTPNDDGRRRLSMIWKPNLTNRVYAHELWKMKNDGRKLSFDIMSDVNHVSTLTCWKDMWIQKEKLLLLEVMKQMNKNEKIIDFELLHSYLE
jgi:hypothetical protein